MIIKTRRSRAKAAIDGVITALGWTGFIYLLTSGVLALVERSSNVAQSAMTGSLNLTLQSLAIYMLIACGNALLVVLWIRYRVALFRSLSRSARDETLDADTMASSFRLSRNQLHEIQDARVTVIYHSNDGDIAQLETPRLTMRE